MLGFIGAGNMAGAIIQGIVSGRVMAPDQVVIYDLDTRRMKELGESFGVVPADTCSALVHACDLIVIAVKPHIVASVLEEQRETLRGKAVISIAAGWTVEKLEAHLDSDVRYLRVMPNTPALAGAGMTAFSLSHTLTPDETGVVERIFRALGRLVWVTERQMEAVIGVSGSGPAYAYMFIEAMADGGVACGLPRNQALELAAQTLLGSAKMALESGMHPGALKDMVCSPGGTTIAAVRSLENDGMRGAVINAVIASAEKAQSLNK